MSSAAGTRPGRLVAAITPAERADGHLGLDALAGLARLAATVCDVPRAGVWVWAADGTRRGDFHGMDDPGADVAAGAPFDAREPIRDAAGDVVGAACVLDDRPRALTAEQAEALRIVAALVEARLQERDQRRREAQLVETHRRLLAIATAAPFGLIITDTLGAPQFMNAGASEVLGFAGEELLEENWDAHIHPDDCPLVWSGWEEAIRDWVIVERQYRVRHADGELRHVRATICPVEAAPGELHGFVTVLNDVTAQAETARALDRSLAALKEQNRRLVELAGARDDLVASVSHELRTPLTSISSFLQLLMADPEATPEQSVAFQVIQRNVGRLELVVGDLLRLKDGGTDLELRLVPVDLAIVAAGAVDDFTDRAAAADVALVLDAPASVWAIGDADRLSQSLDNLVVNALKFTLAGGTITVRALHAAGRCRLEVRDTGVGIPADALPYIFDRFFRSEASAQRHGGSGLGLAIVKQHVEQQGGVVSARSVPGEGATLRLDLPPA